MKNILAASLAALVLGVASAQTTPAQPTPTPAQAQRATTVSANNMAKAQAKTTNNMSRYQRTECAHKHGKIMKNVRGNLVCVLPKK